MHKLLTMEKCLITSSIAVILLCHPNSTVKCFNPKPKTTQRPSPRNIAHQTSSRPPPTRKAAISPSNRPTHLRAIANLQFNLTPRLGFSFGIVESILVKQGWDPSRKIVIDRVLKVEHNDAKVLERFRKYRELVKENGTTSNMTMMMEGLGFASKERLMADGNEILCFRGASMNCSLGSNGQMSVCNGVSCGVCRMMRIIESGGGSSEEYSVRPMLLSLRSWTAHRKAAKRCGSVADGPCSKAIVICRVIAGSVARFGKKENGVFELDQENIDSALLPIRDGDNGSDHELLVSNPSAVLPCFVVVYDVS